MRGKYFDTLVCAAAKVRSLTEQREREWEIAACTFCQSFKGKMHPPHFASPNCESGKRNHCTCDICF